MTATVHFALPIRQLAIQVARHDTQMHKVAESTARTLAHVVLTTTCLAEVSHGRQLADQGATTVIAALAGLEGLARAVFFAELDVDVAHQVIAEIGAHVQLFDLAELREFGEHILVELFKVLLRLFLVEQGLASGGVLIEWRLVHAGQ